MTVQFAARAFGALRARWPPCLEPQPHCDCRPILQSGKEEGSGREMKPVPSGRGGAGGRETPLSLRGPPHTDTLANCFAVLIAFWREVSAHDKLSKEAQGQELNEMAFLRGAWGSGRPSCRGSWGLPSFFQCELLCCRARPHLQSSQVLGWFLVLFHFGSFAVSQKSPLFQTCRPP